MKHHYSYFLGLLLLIMFFACNSNQVNKPTSNNATADSIVLWTENARENHFSREDRIKNVQKALTNLSNIRDDSLRGRLYSKIPYVFYKLNDTSQFKYHAKKALTLSLKNADAPAEADLYWDFANYYLYDRVVLDSAFYYFSKAQKIFEKIDDKKNSGIMLFSMALVQKNVKDYTSSEATTVKAIEMLKKVKDNKRLYGCYNNLGIIFYSLEEYERSLFYYNKAQEYIATDDFKSKVTSYNNIGNVLRNQNKYKEAINNYDLALSLDSIEVKFPKGYALVLDNLAYTKFLLNDTDELPELFERAIHLRDSLGFKSDMVINKLHLAEYYISQHDTLKAIKQATEARDFGIATTNNLDLLSAYILLSEIDDKNAIKHSKDYIKLTTELQKQERTLKNKFARIRYETDEYIVENQRLSQRQFWLTMISVSVLVIGFLLFVLRTQRAKNKELQFERVQQETNEEIYRLMLQQQYKIEEGRQKEKERISEELHDGVLGRLFGTRLSLGSLNKKDSEEAIVTRNHHINELKSIEEEIRNISHELSSDTFNSELGYVAMIETLLQDQSKITNFKYEFENDSELLWEEIPGSTKINLFRILQEAIQNINKYANAKFVQVKFRKAEDALEFLIHDDGIGFNVERSRSGIGLKNMKNRVKKLKGNINITSNTNLGTNILVEVPL